MIDSQHIGQLLMLATSVFKTYFEIFLFFLLPNVFGFAVINMFDKLLFSYFLDFKFWVSLNSVGKVGNLLLETCDIFFFVVERNV